MASRRHLVQRARNNETASPAARSRQRDSGAVQAPADLPPYEAPACPMSAAARQKLEQLQSNSKHEHEKYNKHLKQAALSLNETIFASNERVALRKDKLEKAAAKRAEKGLKDAERSQEDLEAEQYAERLHKEVEELNATVEKAVRELIDYGDELSVQKDFIGEVLEKTTNAGEGAAPADSPEVPSPWEILQSSKEKYKTRYTSRSMKERYASNNDYKGFKDAVHEGQHAAIDNKPPVPHSKHWFPNEGAGPSLRRQTNTQNEEEDDDDDDVMISGATQQLRCPITLQYFREPYSSKECKHTFEKAAILELLENGTVFATTGSNGQRTAQGPRKVQCAVTGCGKWHAFEDLYYDQAMKRRVVQAQKREQRQADGEDSDDDTAAAPRGTQSNRPEEIGDEDDDGIEIDEAEQNRRVKVKQEHAHRRGMSAVNSQNTIEEDGSMDID